VTRDHQRLHSEDLEVLASQWLHLSDVLSQAATAL
jgi:hypothetical protein